MKSVTFGHRLTPITPCTWLPKVWGRRWIPPANSANGRVLVGKQQHLKAPPIQVLHLKGGQCCLVTFVQREAWGKEHNVYASSRASGPFLSSGPELLFQMPIKGEDSPASACPFQLTGCCVWWYHTPQLPWAHTDTTDSATSTGHRAPPNRTPKP